jgi:hypothetical protein
LTESQTPDWVIFVNRQDETVPIKERKRIIVEGNDLIEKDREEMFSRLKTTQFKISTLLESVADNQDWRPNSGAWSFRFIAGHMATVERECHLNRVERIATGTQPHFEYYLNTDRDFSQLDLRVALLNWVTIRQELINFVRALPEERFLLTGTHVTFGTITVVDVLREMHNHDQEHLRDLEQMMAEYRSQA